MYTDPIIEKFEGGKCLSKHTLEPVDCCLINDYDWIIDILHEIKNYSGVNKKMHLGIIMICIRFMQIRRYRYDWNC